RPPNMEDTKYLILSLEFSVSINSTYPLVTNFSYNRFITANSSVSQSQLEIVVSSISHLTNFTVLSSLLSIINFIEFFINNLDETINKCLKNEGRFLSFGMFSCISFDSLFNSKSDISVSFNKMLEDSYSDLFSSKYFFSSEESSSTCSSSSGNKILTSPSSVCI